MIKNDKISKNKARFYYDRILKRKSEGSLDSKYFFKTKLKIENFIKYEPFLNCEQILKELESIRNYFHMSELLILKCRTGRIEKISEYIKKGADVNYINGSGVYRVKSVLFNDNEALSYKVLETMINQYKVPVDLHNHHLLLCCHDHELFNKVVNFYKDPEILKEGLLRYQNIESQELNFFQTHVKKMIKLSDSEIENMVSKLKNVKYVSENLK